MSDHDRIWLQHPDDAEHQEYGRMWADNKVWPNHPEDHEPTEYVRADLYDALAAELAKAREAMESLRDLSGRAVAGPWIAVTGSDGWDWVKSERWGMEVCCVTATNSINASFIAGAANFVRAALAKPEETP